ncbi:MAG TPA: response regulator transcription factor [Clostridia bacterium]|nr:response regulator transcription factor [Clostridia bacterium]
MRILAVEDDAALRQILVKRLEAEGYAVDGCSNGLDGLDYAQSVEYDCILLDIMLPGLSGLEVLNRLRAGGCGTSILMLTARDGIGDRVLGLDAGADDYLVKPFAFDELLARLRVLMRRHTKATTTLLQLGDLTMDTRAHAVSRNGREIALTAKEYAMLEYFLRNAGAVLTRTQLIDHVWNFEGDFESNLVDVYVRYLRNKIDKDEPVKLLHTVRGYGYVLKIGEDV